MRLGYTFSGEQVLEIEDKTRGQAACERWHKKRVGRVTGSSAHKGLHSSLENPSKALLRDIMKKGSPKANLNADPTIWDRVHEKDAIETYKLVLGLTTPGITQTSITVSNDIYKPHQNLKINPAGFRVCKDKPYIGVSSDASVSCAWKGVVEAKCPWKWSEDVFPVNWPADKSGHLETISSLRKSYKY